MLSLNHSMWFHALPSVDDWLLYEGDSPFAGDGYGLGRGVFYDRRRRHLATCAQQLLYAGG